MEEKTNKLGVFKTAQIKRMAMGMRPIEAKIVRLTAKIEEMMAERATLNSQIADIQSCIRAYVGDEDQMLEAAEIVAEVLKGKKAESQLEEAPTGTEEETPTQTLEDVKEIEPESPIIEEEAPGAEFEPGIQEETSGWATSK